MINLGVIARADSGGLSYQTASYIKHLNPEKILLVEIDQMTGKKTNLNAYPEAIVSSGFPQPSQIKDFLMGLDVVLTAETPYNYDLYKIAKAMNVKTVEATNYEFMMYPSHRHLPRPDVIILPSIWHENETRLWCEQNSVKFYQLHHPVDRDDFPFIKRTTTTTMHIAGKPAAHDRNGTMQYMDSTDKQRVTTQDDAFARNLRRMYRTSRVITGIDNPQDMYKVADILVLPRKYGGNCLPLNEALSSGMPVIMPDIEPNNALLPKEWLVPAKKVGEFHPRTKVDIYEVDPRDLAEKYRWFSEQSMELQSEIANAIANKIRWEIMKPKYMEVLEA